CRSRSSSVRSTGAAASVAFSALGPARTPKDATRPCRRPCYDGGKRPTRSEQMEIPADLRYSKEHEWVRLDGETATVGITDFAQDQLGDIVYLNLPASGTVVQQF